MATPGIVATQKKRGISSLAYQLSQQRQTILQQSLVGTPDAVPYQPFKRPGGGGEMGVQESRNDFVDYCTARTQEWTRLARRAGGGLSGVFTSQSSYRPVLISEREMARMNQRYNPSLGLIYATEGPMQERHDENTIRREAGKRVKTGREKNLGAAGMVK